MQFCCDEFMQAVTSHKAFKGGYNTYPKSIEPIGQIEQVDGEWHVNGCCGGGCYVLVDLKFCPFCGFKLSEMTIANNQEGTAEGNVDTQGN